MKKFNKIILLMATFGLLMVRPLTAGAQLEILADKQPQARFSGGEKPIAIKIHNPTESPIAVNLRVQLYQATSATAVSIGEPVVWKKLEVLSGQTVLETNQINFPPVKGVTHFLIKWLDDTTNIVGTTEVIAYPTNLLLGLNAFSDKQPLGIYDPENQLKPLLKILRVEFDDLGDSGIENFSGKLAIIGPFSSQEKKPETLSKEIQASAKKGAMFVWLQPPSTKNEKLQPSFYIVSKFKGTIAIVQPDLVENLSENPRSQLNLISICDLVANPRSGNFQPSLPPAISNQ